MLSWRGVSLDAALGSVLYHRDCPRRGASVGGILLPLVWHRHVRQPEVRALSEVPEWALVGEVQTRGLPSFLRSLLQPVNPWVGDSWQIYNEYYQWDNGTRARGCLHSPPPWLAATPAPPRLSRLQFQQRGAHRQGGRLALREHYLQPREPVLHDLPQGPHGRLVCLDEHPRREGQERRVQGARLAACQWRWKRPCSSGIRPSPPSRRRTTPSPTSSSRRSRAAPTTPRTARCVPSTYLSSCPFP